LSARNIQNGHIDWREAYSYITEENYLAIQRTNPVSEGDVLLTIVGSIGRSCVNRTSDRFTVQRSVAIARPDPSLTNTEYLSLLFRAPQFQGTLESLASGTAQRGVYLGALKEISILLAPLNEQRRIVAKLEKLLSRVDAAQARLATIPHILKRFRQSVLAAACSGKLTADWREKNGIGQEYEPAIIGDVADYVGGFAYRSPTFTKSGANQVIRIGNVRPFSLKLDASPVFIPDEIGKATERFQLVPDDIVISMTGTKYKKDYGNAAIVTRTDHKLFLNQRVSRLRCKKKVLPLFMLYWFQTDIFRDFFFEGETGNVNQGNIGADGIRKAPIELPSLSEQQEIVHRVEALFKTGDVLEARYRKAKAHVDKLTQSILAKAFRGELVPQDPTDEPASILLERIRKDRGLGNEKSESVNRRRHQTKRRL
jgi:type I restriction enzyme S subunit